jgi:hypothetical protein
MSLSLVLYPNIGGFDTSWYPSLGQLLPLTLYVITATLKGSLLLKHASEFGSSNCQAFHVTVFVMFAGTLLR